AREAENHELGPAQALENAGELTPCVLAVTEEDADRIEAPRAVAHGSLCVSSHPPCVSRRRAARRLRVADAAILVPLGAGPIAALSSRDGGEGCARARARDGRRAGSRAAPRGRGARLRARLRAGRAAALRRRPRRSPALCGATRARARSRRGCGAGPRGG